MKEETGLLFDPASAFSADDLVSVIRNAGPETQADWILKCLREGFATKGLPLSRILHSLGTAIGRYGRAPEHRADVSRLLGTVHGRLSRPERSWLAGIGISADAAARSRAWTSALQDAAFENISRTIVYGQGRRAGKPQNALRSDEIIWGRAPARLDLGGGWTDTPPYSLENGGCVINAAVDLNGQPPIQVYARVIPEPVIRIYSIDHGAQLTIRTMAQLLDYRLPTSKFGLAKATLALCGFGPGNGSGRKPAGGSLKARLEEFGGGIELSTLAAIPSGSGLGTSSIMGAVIMAVVHRMIGRNVAPRELFNLVLQLEQELTTGGGWQDQIGGVLPGVKMIRTEAGMIPDPRIHYVPADVLDPRADARRGGMGTPANEGHTLLYYTGLRRLAKNILRTVVGNYLDRGREAMDTLRELYDYPPKMTEAMAAKDMRRFGELIDLAWRLNKRIDPDSTTPVIEGILGRIKKHVRGAKLLGAGGGGFLLIVAKSPEDAARIRRILTEAPPNSRARFFEYDISREGLNVTVC